MLQISALNTHRKSLKEDGSLYITSCAPIDSNVIVCGKERLGCTGDSVDGCITLYDRQWNVIRNISIPRNRSSYCLYYVCTLMLTGMG